MVRILFGILLGLILGMALCDALMHCECGTEESE